MAKKGIEAFDQHYASVYGERWASLRAALEAPARRVARPNLFAETSQIAARSEGRGRVPLGTIEAVELAPGEAFQPQSDSSGKLDFYLMDPASILAAAALEVSHGDEVLDLCAAPGGKSLILAEAMFASKSASAEDRAVGRLVSNELSPNRRGRLRAVLEDYLPRELFEKRVQVSGHDGARWCLHEKDAFDRILVDAPCSGERHLLNNRDEMKLWSPARSKNLAVRQYALLTSALAVVRSGGRIVYSTCSISPLENDEVIARLLKKRAGEARVVKAHANLGEATEHGWSILPDQAQCGPIYFAVLEKT